MVQFDVIHLGALLIGLRTATDRTLKARPSDLHIAIASHNALILLRCSFTAPIFLHIHECTPCDGHLLQAPMTIFYEMVSAIYNYYFGDFQRIQPGPSILEGGLGIRRVSSLALSPF